MNTKQTPGSSLSFPDEEKRRDETIPVATDTEKAPREIGGRKGPEPTRYGDWEKNGRCIDF